MFGREIMTRVLGMCLVSFFFRSALAVSVSFLKFLASKKLSPLRQQFQPFIILTRYNQVV
jgi:hypothetical protein